jgi:hypothetical protein
VCVCVWGSWNWVKQDFFTELVGENRVKHANVFFDPNGNPTGVGEVAFYKRSNMFMARRVANGVCTTSLCVQYIGYGVDSNRVLGCVVD